jgi:hypothetical protein
MSVVDIGYALGQMEKYGNVIIASPNRFPRHYVTDPASGQNEFDRALGPLHVMEETDEQEFLKRMAEFGMGDVRKAFEPPIFYYLAVAE